MLREGADKQVKERFLAPPSTLILGVGNILLSDEGVGVRIVEAMGSRVLPANVELFDGGTASLDLLDTLANRDRVIIIDAVKGGEEPGTVYRFHPNDITVQRPPLTSVHQVGLFETLAMAEYLGCAPREVTVFGIEPKEMGWGLELSSEMMKVVPRVIELVISELGGEYARTIHCPKHPTGRA
jgi:hydrogenase maturation protease